MEQPSLMYSSFDAVVQSAEKDFPKKIDNAISVDKFVRSSFQISQKARIFLAEEDLENAFIMNYRFVILAFNLIPKHKDYTTIEQSKREHLKKQATKALEETEKLKAQLKKMYAERERAEENKKLQELKKIEEEKIRQSKLSEEQKFREAMEKQKKLEELQNQPFAMRGLLQEQERINRAQQEELKKLQKPTDKSKDKIPSQERRESVSTPDSNPVESGSLIDLGDVPLVANTKPTIVSPSLLDQSMNENTPKTMITQGLPEGAIPLGIVPPGIPFFPPDLMPQQLMFVTPEAPVIQDTSFDFPSFVPQTIEATAPPFPQEIEPVEKTPPTVNSAPKVDIKPKENVVKVSAPPPPKPEPMKVVRDDGRLRNLVVDGQMFTKFMEIADFNTRREIETCGILAGKLKQNTFYVTHLIIPEQKGSSDTCEMVDEDQVFVFQDENDLLTLGWIHTHPTHELFLSSVDMHTHFSYQSLLKEAIAVVIAPRFNPNFGIFSLKDPLGLVTIQSCKQRGFHPHQRGLYINGEHVRINWQGTNFQIKDLRKKRTF